MWILPSARSWFFVQITRETYYHIHKQHNTTYIVSYFGYRWQPLSIWLTSFTSGFVIQPIGTYSISLASKKIKNWTSSVHFSSCPLVQKAHHHNNKDKEKNDETRRRDHKKTRRQDHETTRPQIRKSGRSIHREWEREEREKRERRKREEKRERERERKEETGISLWDQNKNTNY